MKTLLQKILLSAAFCLVMVSARGQWVTIPDTNFVNWLNANGFAGGLNGNQMDTTWGAIVNASSIDCRQSNISDLTGISYFDNLGSLDCNSNQLTFLPPMPASLHSLDCHNNLLTALPALPTSLNNLYCQSNQLTSLPSISFILQLHILWCSYNQLGVLPTLPALLMSLQCDHNQLQSLPVLPSFLNHLSCSDNQLTFLPTLDTSLTGLNCNSNLLTSLPVLPSSITSLSCAWNYLTTLPFLPPALNYLNCNNNLLSSLPAIPSTQITINCGYNQLTYLPALPQFLGFLSCNHNLLTSLPALPPYLSTLNCDSNSLLSCLPPINNIINFYWSNTSIQCMPNAFFPSSAIPSIDTVPICDLFNLNNCPVYWNIKGTTYSDINSNCVIDSNEHSCRNVKLNLFSNGNLIQQNFTNYSGQYSFDTDTGTFICSVDTSDLPFDIDCPVGFNYTTTVTSLNLYNNNKDFSLQCKPGFDVGVTSVIRTAGRFRPGNNSTVNILAGDLSNHYGLGCATGVNGTVTIIINGPATYISPSPGALTPIVNGDTLTYTIPDYGTTNFNSDFNFIVQTDSTAQVGDQICFDVSVTPITGDNNPTNNNYSQCFTISNSYDPNEKEVYPSGSIDTSQHYLTYTIYFQNTGNDTAQHIYILDTLDNAIDESSIQLLAYSHEPLVQVFGNVIKFNFPNINLPDSTTDEVHSHGYVQYRVRIKDGTVVGTQIHNTAHIVFDFNTPVVTNTTFNQVSITTSAATIQHKNTLISLYPNPLTTGNDLKMIFDSPNDKQAVLAVYDVSGRIVFTKAISSFAQSQTISLPSLAAGVYSCVVRSEYESHHAKLVVVSSKIF